MRTHTVILAFALVVAAALGAGCTAPAPIPGNQSNATQASATAPAASPVPSTGAPQQMTPADLAEFVQNASAYVKAVGEQAALAEFQKKDGRFSRGDMYIYAHDRNGTLLAHPYQPDLVGTDRSNWTDARGLPFVRIGNATASNGGGFVANLYPAVRNGTIDEKALDAYEPKIGYVAPAGDRIWIGAGVHLADLAQNGTGPDPVSEMVDLVERCAAYSRNEGRAAAFAAISNRTGQFVDKDGHYIYAYDYNGTLLAHPHLPEKVGTSLIGRTDPFGMKNIRSLVDTAHAGGGYIVFVWPNPDKGNRDEIKIGYVLPVDDTWWVGSGTYLSEITGRDSPLTSPVP
jgi:two-component system NarL family sensor kinase